ncbi:MAG: hypothetical protein JW955_19705 [Sedimentisphaerales bacterium]|nr:hypothetical protein [Sedimentisphaerales bacterium]
MDEKPHNTCALPPYLLPLLEPRPCGEAKLLAAWDGLCTEHQILLLDSLGKHGHLDWTTKIRAKALETPNAYVRYLAARDFRPDDAEAEEADLRRRIDSDDEPLVRYAVLESDSFISPFIRFESEFSDAGAFFALPHEARLATVRSLPHLGEAIAALVRYAVQNELPSGRVTEEELAHLLLEYLANPHFKSHYGREEISYDGYGEYMRGEDIAALWKLVPDVSERISYGLIANLPEKSGYGTGMPDEVPNRMSRRQLGFLLERPDIGLKELRKKIFLQEIHAESEKRDPMDCLCACAIGHNFNLSNEEFAEILAEDDKGQARILSDLALYAHDLSLCIFQAVHDVLGETEWDEDGTPHERLWENAAHAADRLSERLARLPADRREWEAHEWRLYELAKQAAPWRGSEERYAPSGEFEFLAEHVKEGDTWLTFMAFCKVWEAKQPQLETDRIDRLLRRRFPLTEEDWNAPDEPDTFDENEDVDAPDDEHSPETHEAHEGTVPEIKRPLTKGDFLIWTLSVEKFALVIFVGLLVFGLGIAAIKNIAVNLYAGKYWMALAWSAGIAVPAFAYWCIHEWYYRIELDQRRIRDAMSE